MSRILAKLFVLILEIIMIIILIKVNQFNLLTYMIAFALGSLYTFICCMGDNNE